MTHLRHGGGTAAGWTDTMFHDFEFEAAGGRVECMRGARNPAAGHTIDPHWWYLSLAGAPPVRLLRVRPGETPREVWESALRHLANLG